MRLYWSVFVSLITSGFATESIVLPLCCENTDEGFYINYDTCDRLVEDSSSIFKREWMGYQSIEWDFNPIMCLEKFPMKEQDYKINGNGDLLLPCKGSSCCGNNHQPISYKVNWEFGENMQFCMDAYLNGSIVAHVCNVKSQPTTKAPPPLAQKICLVISSLLLVITCAIYLAEKSVKNENYAPYLVSQSISLGAAFMCLARIQFFPEISHCWECLLAGYGLQYFFLAAFFWMNAKCINVYMIMSRPHIQTGKNRMIGKLRRQEFKRFSLYAWGVPFLITATTFSVQFFWEIEYPHIKPDIGIRVCFLHDDTVKWIYFYGAVAVIIVVDIILFLLTATIIAKKRIQAASKGLMSRKEKSRLKKEIWFFNKFLNLFIVTGLGWLGEVVAIPFKDREEAWLKILWQATDIFNCLQGVFIFVFFVCQKEVLVKKLFCIPKNFKLKACSLCCCGSSYAQSPPTTQVEMSMNTADESTCQNDETANSRLSSVFKNSTESVMYESVELDEENTT